MRVEGKISLNLNLRQEVIQAVERFQHQQEMKNRTVAIEQLLILALGETAPELIKEIVWVPKKSKRKKAAA